MKAKLLAIFEPIAMILVFSFTVVIWWAFLRTGFDRPWIQIPFLLFFSFGALIAGLEGFAKIYRLMPWLPGSNDIENKMKSSIQRGVDRLFSGLAVSAVVLKWMVVVFVGGVFALLAYVALDKAFAGISKEGAIIITLLVAILFVLGQRRNLG